MQNKGTLAHGQFLSSSVRPTPKPRSEAKHWAMFSDPLAHDPPLEVSCLILTDLLHAAENLETADLSRCWAIDGYALQRMSLEKRSTWIMYNMCAGK